MPLLAFYPSHLPFSLNESGVSFRGVGEWGEGVCVWVCVWSGQERVAVSKTRA